MKKTASAIVDELADSTFVVDTVKKKTTKRNPQPPFTTSKLQQESIRKLRFSARKTMTIAQQLYEGVELGPGEQVGLITYMRTDSTRISREAAEEAIKLVHEKFGDDYTLEKPRFFKNKKKAQDAHEAIRPTSVYNTPEKVAAFLSPDQLRLYRLIWQRFVASQMQQALINNMTISITAGPYLFNATGSAVKFPGFMALYMASDDEAARSLDKKDLNLPELSKEMILELLKLDPKQHFTQPPPPFFRGLIGKGA